MLKIDPSSCGANFSAPNNQTIPFFWARIMATTRQIYVVGYPKSGNTWLTRMIAKATRFPVALLEGSTAEIAMDVNKEIEREGSIAEGNVFKIHDMPNVFESRLARGACRHEIKIIYIYREIEDVFISSFFYFKRNNYECNNVEDYIKKPDDSENRFNPTWLAKRMYWRTKLNLYLGSFIRHGYDSVTYVNHLSAWLAYLKDCNGRFDFVITRYEDLIGNQARELERICKRIGFKELDTGALKSIAESESFSRRKRAVGEASDELTFGKEFNINFLRAGKIGDHKRFLTSGQSARLRREMRLISKATLAWADAARGEITLTSPRC